MPFENELRLLFTLCLTAGVFTSTYALARRLGAGGRLQAACDALLLGYVIQYVSVALPGVVGRLNVISMSAVALLACTLCWIGARAKRRVITDGLFADAPPPSAKALRQNGDAVEHVTLLLRGIGRPDRLGFVAAGAFVLAFVGIYAFIQSPLPVLATDPLVYHLPAAVQWMQTGRLGLFDTWYWNPAATWSPATSSTFMYWLMAPMRSDVLVRYLQVPPLLMIFCIVARLCRILGCSLTVAGLIAAAATLCRPFFASESMIPKDDLLVTAFFGAAVLSLAGNNPRDRLGPWRVGLAMGMVLACKYTVLLACPLFLFLVDVPFRAVSGRRSAMLNDDGDAEDLPREASTARARRAAFLRWSLAALVALSLFAPWYFRTWRITGNPLYPVDVRLFGRTIFHGMFTTEHDQQLRSLGGVWKMLVTSYHSLPLLPLLAVVLGWVAAVAGAGRLLWRDPLTRACLVGAPVTLLLFLLASPHHEVRYAFPLFLLVYAALGFAIRRWLPAGHGLRIGAAALVTGASVATSFDSGLTEFIVEIALGSAVASAAITGAAFGLSRLAKSHPAQAARLVTGGAIVSGFGFLIYLYVGWPSYINAYRLQTEYVWSLKYPPQGDLWNYIRNNTPTDSTIAFANTSFVYPLYGFDYTRRVVYAPVRPDITRFASVPRLGDTVPGDDIVLAMTRTQNANADRQTWLRNLTGVQYLLVHKSELVNDPPELRFAREEPARFVPVFENDYGVVFQIGR